MRNLCANAIVMAGLVLASIGAWAIEPDTLNGRVLDVDENERTLTVEVLEVGDEISVTTETVRTFRVPESADIRAGLQTDILNDRLGEIQEGVVVSIEMDVDSQDSARNIRYLD